MRLIRPALLLLALSPAFAADPPDPAVRYREMRKEADTLKYQKGTIELQGGLARIALPDDFRYLSPSDTDVLLTKVWGNPKGAKTLGTIVPADFDPLGDSSWAVVVSYGEDGYVKDDDAAKVDYDDLLRKMKEETRKANEERTKAGYPAIELVGWAEPPRYDPAAHKLYWAKEIKFGGEKVNTLNYNIRMLGRGGVLVLNAVANMSQLQSVKQATPGLLRMVDFQPGHRYADFNSSTDKVATYGIAALVAGGIAAKMGLLKFLWVGILAFKKIIILALIALAGTFKKAWAWIRGRETETAVVPGSSDPPKA
jgi:uncharacterized membrane-anchored protein